MAEKKIVKKAPAKKKAATRKKATKNTLGRPTLLTENLTKEVAKYIKNGAYIETAAALAGISPTTFHLWLRTGKRLRVKEEKGEKLTKADLLHVSFSHAIEKAQAFSEYNDIQLIGQHAQTEWAAAAWRLERKFPSKYGRAKRLTVKEERLLEMQILKLEAELNQDDTAETALDKFINLVQGKVAENDKEGAGDEKE